MSEQVLNVRVAVWHAANSQLANDLSARVLSGKDLPPPGASHREDMARSLYRTRMGIKALGEGFELRVSDTTDPVTEPIESNAGELMAAFRLRQEHSKVDPLVKAIVEGIQEGKAASGALSADGLAKAVAAGVAAALGQPGPSVAPAQPAPVQSEAPRPDVSPGTMSRKQR
jgi:hypothetical protein